MLDRANHGCGEDKLWLHIPAPQSAVRKALYLVSLDFFIEWRLSFRNCENQVRLCTRQGWLLTPLFLLEETGEKVLREKPCLRKEGQRHRGAWRQCGMREQL